MMEMTEADWKVLRQLRPIALDRLCARILAEAGAVIADESKSNHERYLALFALIQDRDEEIARGFNGVSRGNAFFRLAAILGMDLLTDDEFARFGPDTREKAEFLAGRREL